MIKEATNGKTYYISVYCNNLEFGYKHYVEQALSFKPDKYYAAENILHPITKETIITAGTILSEQEIKEINSAGIRSINVLDKKGTKSNLCSDVDGLVYNSIYTSLYQSCERKSRANYYASVSCQNHNNKALEGKYRYYDPDLLTSVLAADIYSNIFPELAAEGVPFAGVSKRVNSYIKNIGYKSAISAIYGSKKRCCETAVSSFSDSETEISRTIIDIIPANDGESSESVVLRQKVLAEYFSDEIVKYFRPCTEKNNSIAKAMVSYMYNVMLFDYSRSDAGMIIASLLRKASTFEDVKIQITKYISRRTVFALSKESVDILSAAMEKTPTGKAFVDAGNYKTTSWKNIPVSAVYGFSEIRASLIKVHAADYIKSIKYFENSKGYVDTKEK